MAGSSGYENEEDNEEGEESIEKKDDETNEWGGAVAGNDSDADDAKDRETGLQKKMVPEDRLNQGEIGRGEKEKEASTKIQNDKVIDVSAVRRHSNKQGDEEDKKILDDSIHDRNKKDKVTTENDYDHGKANEKEMGSIIDNSKNRKGDNEENKGALGDSSSNDHGKRENDERKKNIDSYGTSSNKSNVDESNRGQEGQRNKLQVPNEKMKALDETSNDKKEGVNQKRAKTMCIDRDSVDTGNNLSKIDQTDKILNLGTTYASDTVQNSSHELVGDVIMDDVAESKLEEKPSPVITKSKGEEKEEEIGDKVSHTRDEAQQHKLNKPDPPPSCEQRKEEDNKKKSESSSRILLDTSFGCGTFTDAGVKYEKKYR